ncbi:MAG: hypothetical protein JNJ76_04365 [Candidatus Competibacter sp.]|nr:hypothetical protein [Candidatus Competibacter sp.]
MNQPKLSTLVEAGTIERIIAKPDSGGWVVLIQYKTLAGLHIEPLERQRGGARIFATLDAVARCLAGAGLSAFRVSVAGLAGEESP